VRQCNIAILPSEQIQTEYGYASVYLVEARSIGGISGSPVLVRPTVRYWAKGESGSDVLIDGVETSKFKLLGLMHGHWDVRESEINNPEIEQDRKCGVNYGVAIVTPASKVLETINQSGLMEMRKEREQQLNRKSVPGMDSVKAERQEKPFTKQDFETALQKASRKIEKSREGN
jgi:hypothetical protein